ncbi:peptidoglycan DD-metalloendopeptidase family protein [Vibrio cionasavignyae]|uniref:peptidoglycan DD-metalloendopeptidase family protein n=1 Tax=Vibrio cionasavignyae TaxID=2910252 RepID=UPI003D0A886E
MTSFTLPHVNYQRLLPIILSTSLAVTISSMTYHLSSSEEKPSVQNVNSVTDRHFKELYDKHFQRTKIISGIIDYSFITSVINSGLSQKEIKSLISIIEKHFDIISSVQNGDKFAIKYQTNSDNDRYISSFYYTGRKFDFFILQDENYNTYNRNGYKLSGEPFYTHPLSEYFRVSSSFNLKRKHPTTKKVTPHFGTDYASPIGTKLFSIADGIVVKSKYNQFAGDFINIRHSNGSLSRYLHLSKRNVNVGDKVSKGELIGLTGNSGRTTGPHLHLELFVEGRPVNYERYIQNSRHFPNQKMKVKAKIERAELIKKLSKLTKTKTTHI